MSKQKGFIHILPLIFILILIGSVIGILFFGNTDSLKLTAIPQSLITENYEIRLEDSQVVSIVNSKKTILVTNVYGVSEVKMGPDGNTLHFKPQDKNTPNQKYCGVLEQNTSSVDFKKIGGCEGNGYLSNANYFVYLRLESTTDGFIVYKDLDSGKESKVKVEVSLLSGFNTTDPNNGTYWVEEKVGPNGFRYYFPHQDIKMGNKLVVAFGRLALVFDASANKFIGGTGFNNDNYAIVANVIRFVNEKNLPFILVETGWEGPAFYTALIDISGDKFKVVKLTELDSRPILNLNLPQVATWQNNEIMFNFAQIKYIDIPKSFSDTHNLEDAQNSPSQLSAWARELEASLDNNYQKVVCDLNFGQYVPACEGLEGIMKYKYSSNTGLIKI